MWDGSPGPLLHLCCVLRELDSLDEGSSSVRIKTGNDVNGKYCSRTGGVALLFRPKVVGGAQVFTAPSSADVFCDRVVRNAVVRAGLKGVRLQDTTDH
jgi:hypothetical protein